MINKDFYPTPDWITEKLLSGFDFKRNLHVLDPSGGKGDMLMCFKTLFDKWTRYEGREYSIKSLDCIEIERELQAILRDKELKVVHDDFLTFNCTKAYDLILANFPFSEGDKHLMMAMKIQERFGGELRCIVNAATIKNPCTNLREEIMRMLKKYEASIEFLKDGFVDAERMTSVEVALIKLKMPAKEYKSIILDSLEKDDAYKKENSGNPGDLIPFGNEIEQAVLFYQNEIAAGLPLIREYYTIKKKFNLALTLGDPDNTEKDTINTFVESTRDKYWRKLIDTSSFFKKIPRSSTDELYKRMNELCNYDFNYFNIVQIQDMMQKSLSNALSDTILSLFNTLSHKYAYGDGLQNKLHYDGWKTNLSYKVNEKKAILPSIYAYGQYSNKDNLDVGYSDKATLADIHKSLRFLDTGMSEPFDLEAKLSQTKDPKNVDCPYFILDFYKKGTCHIKWKRTDLIEKLNIYGSQKKGWLPPTYGNKAYKDMDAEEKAVVDSFQGESEYAKVCLEKSKYFITNPLALASGMEEIA